MKEIVITLTLLLFELGINSGYTIPEIEMKNETDVYELQVGSSDAVRIISPKPEKPTLREIIYYHIIERPYGRPGEQKLEGPDFDETRRSFTNGHGYQFLGAESPENSSEVIDPVIVKIAEENAAKDEILKGTFDDAETEAAPEPEPVTGSELIAEEVIEDIKNETGKNPEPEIPVTVGDIVSEQKNSRNQLFGQNKERYQKRKLPEKKNPEQSIPSMKQKREVDWEDLEDIPDGPTLAELNFSGLPDYLKTLIPTEQLKLYSQEERDDTKLDANIKNKGDPKEEMDEKLEKIFDYLLADTEREVHATKVDENKQSSKGPTTYGMNLTLGRGYVWNDLWSKDGLLFDVGDIETADELEKNKDNNNDDSYTDETNPTEDEKTPSNDKEKPNHDQDIFVNVTKDKSKQPLKETHNKKDSTLNKNHEDLKPAKEITPSPAEKEKSDQNGVKEKPNSSQEKDKHKDHTDLSCKNTDQDKNKPPKQENKEDKKDTKDSKNNNPDDKSNTANKQSNAFKEIISDELFWSWLANWTSKYLAFMNRNIEKLVAAEVEKQFESYNEKRNNKDKKNENLETSLETNKDEITVNDQLEKGTNGSTTEKPEPTIKDDKLTIDGKNNPITNKTNFDMSNNNNENKDINNSENKDDNNSENIDNNGSENIDDTNLLKKRQDKDNKIPVSKNDTNDGEKQPVKVLAQTIYGNSVGNDKVTNIFIFYPDKDIDKKINHINHITGGNESFTSGPQDDITLDKRVKPDSNKKVHISNDTTTENPGKHEPIDEIKNSENEKGVSINKTEVPEIYEGDNIKSDKKDTQGPDTSTETVEQSESKKEDKKSEVPQNQDEEKNSKDDKDKTAAVITDEAKDKLESKVDANFTSEHTEDTKKTEIVKEKEDSKTNETAVIAQ